MVKNDPIYSQLPSYEEIVSLYYDFCNQCSPSRGREYSFYRYIYRRYDGGNKIAYEHNMLGGYYFMHRYFKKMPIKYWIEIADIDPSYLCDWYYDNIFKPFVYLKDVAKKDIILGSAAMFLHLQHISDQCSKPQHLRVFKSRYWGSEKKHIAQEFNRLIKKYPELQAMSMLLL